MLSKVYNSGFLTTHREIDYVFYRYIVDILYCRIISHCIYCIITCLQIVTLKDQLRFAVDIGMGMNYLQDVLCVHRDLAARNCM